MGMTPTPLHTAAIRAPRLTREEEAELARRWQQDRDRDAQDILFRSQLRAVVWCCRRYANLHSYEEAISEGCLGLLHAIDKFEPEKGRLSTYAVTWIRQRAQEAIDLRQVRLPPRDVTIVKAALRRGETDPDTIAAKTARSASVVRPMVEQLTAPSLWIDEPFRGSDGSPFSPLDLVAATESHEDAVLDADEHRVRWDAVTRAQSRLDQRERLVLARRFGRDHESLADIGRDMGVSRERVRQLEARALRKLRKAVGCG